MLFNKKNKSPRVFSVACGVTNNQLTAIVGKYAKSQFYIAIEGLENDDPICQSLSAQSIETVCSNNAQEMRNIVIKAHAADFSSFVDLLLDCEAELVLFYFPNAPVPFEQFIINEYGACGIGQKTVISRGDCPMICTWVTNDYELFFHYNAEVYPSDIRKEIRKMLGD